MYPDCFFSIRSVDTMKNKHLCDHDRIIIDNGLKDGLSFKAIARKLNKDCTTVSKEVKKHIQIRKIAGYGRVFNNCAKRFECSKVNSACSVCSNTKSINCSRCPQGCYSYCTDFVEDVCPKLSKPPYVCNGCIDRNKCSLTKHFYYALQADKEYKQNLSDSRKGIVINDEEIKHLNDLLVPLVKDQKQSIHHVYIHHKDEIMMSEKTLYKIIDAGLLEIRNIDLPRKVRYRKRKKSSSYKVDRSCLEGRRFEDFQLFMKNNPDISVVEMDTVEGIKGESCLLTIHFTVCNFMIAIKREYNDSKSVTDYFDYLYDLLGRELFMKLFPVTLTDNGSEFSNPKAIEFDKDGNRRTYVFYCHPSAPFEKGACEVNHGLLRRIVPKGKSWNPYEQRDINIMMSHINSYAREKLNDKSPLLLFKILYGEDITRFFNISSIDPDDVNLSSSVIK